MPTEPTDLKDEHMTEEPVAPVPAEPTDLKDEPVTQKPVAPVIKILTDQKDEPVNRGAFRSCAHRARRPQR